MRRQAFLSILPAWLVGSGSCSSRHRLGMANDASLGRSCSCKFVDSEAVLDHDGGHDLLAEVGVRHAEDGDSTTPGIPASAASTAAGAMFSPPRMIMSFERPVIHR